MLKVFYSSFGDREALQVQLDEIRGDLARRNEGLIAALEPMTDGVHPFPEREHMTNLLIRAFHEEPRCQTCLAEGGRESARVLTRHTDR